MKLNGIVFSVCLLAVTIDEASAGQWFVRPYTGISSLSDSDGNSQGVGAVNGAVPVELDDGFFAGLGVGYRYSDRFAVEFAGEYRSNDSAVSLADGQQFNDGNYASVTFFLNGFYHFKLPGAWQLYLGGGLSIVEEIDIDLEQGGVEQSFSASGEVGLQVFAGIDYILGDHWTINAELRHSRLGKVDLEGEGAAIGEIQGLDYAPSSLQLGVRYGF